MRCTSKQPVTPKYACYATAYKEVHKSEALLALHHYFKSCRVKLRLTNEQNQWITFRTISSTIRPGTYCSVNPELPESLLLFGIVDEIQAFRFGLSHIYRIFCCGYSFVS